MTQRLCRACRDWHDLDKPWPLQCSGHFRLYDGRSALAFPMVISDYQPEMQCMADGKYYDSKAKMRAAHKAHGLIEVGNDVDATLKLAEQKPARPKVTKAEIAQALNKVKNGYRPVLPAD